jgi:hypothetical protein
MGCEPPAVPRHPDTARRESTARVLAETKINIVTKRGDNGRKNKAVGF